MLDLSRLSEKGLLRYIARDLTDFSTAFRFMIFAALGDSFDDWEIECYFNIPRTELGLSASARPGDIDALLIPVFDGDRFAERSMAVEVKRFVLPTSNRGRSPDSLGTDQVNGLVSDGFPFVGLLHVPLVHQSPKNEWIELPVMKTGLIKEGEPEFARTIQIDWPMDDVTKRHEGRLERMQIPKSAGYNIYSIELDDRKDRIVGCSVRAWRRASKNSGTKRSLVDVLRGLDREPDCCIRYSHGGGSIANYNPDRLE